MKKIKKLISAMLALAVASTMLFSGCSSTQQGGSSSTQPQSQSGASASSEAPSEQQSAEPVTLKFTYWGSAFEKSAMDKLISGFQEKYPNITVESQHIPADYEAKMSAMVAGNEAPDIGYVRDFMALDFAKQDMLYNIFDFIDADPDLEREDFMENLFLYWDKGKSYGMYTAGEAYGLFYNKAAFEAAGVEPLPTKPEEALSWDELVELTKKLTIDQNGKNATEVGFDKTKIKQYGIRFDFNQGAYMPLVHANGGDYVTDDNQFGLAQPEGLDVITKMGSLVTEYGVAPSPAEVKSLPSTAVSLTTSQAAIIMIGQWVLLDLAESGVDFGVGVLPKMSGDYVTSPGWGTMGIFKTTEHPDEAFLFWKWVCDPENSVEVHKAGLWMPLMKKWYTEQEYLEKWAMNNPAHPEGYVDAFAMPLLNNFAMHPSAYVKNFAKIDAVVQPALERIYMGQETPEQAMSGIQAEVEGLIEGKYVK